MRRVEQTGSSPSLGIVHTEYLRTLDGPNITASKVYFPEEKPIHVHRSRVQPSPASFHAGYDAMIYTHTMSSMPGDHCTFCEFSKRTTFAKILASKYFICNVHILYLMPYKDGRMYKMLVSTKDLVLGVTIDGLKPNRASEVIDI